MAFQSMADYNENKYGDRFRLSNDGDCADVIFLYTDIHDVLVGNVHYLNYPEYSGYVHCLEHNCPVCKSANKVRLQRRIFIPLYLINEDRVVFWDRTTNIENQLQRDVFSNYPNPSKVVFRITREGEYRDINTKYKIEAIGSNSVMSYSDICTKFNIKFPDYYETICEDKSMSELESIVNGRTNTYNFNGVEASSEMINKLPEYQTRPRAILDSAIDISSQDTSGVSEETVKSEELTVSSSLNATETDVDNKLKPINGSSSDIVPF